ncbi:MAG: methyltransferase domain-containing protein [Acidobacteria bacterium]|nr:methyltransferase domain-containing protein [Acidobacteriota bacterium]MBI3424496.1 methyltransferase domain-containing protein [Acidobacteriota bacterium]
MYGNQNHAGSTPDFWEENWAAGQFEDSVRFCAVDPLRPLFEKYLRPASLMLEGGCGMGHYLAYYAARGFSVVGLDFAEQALKTLHKRQPQLPLSCGDVAQMPFADKTFDLYYSGGVVEHFEAGAEKSLAEARRVLKDEGVLLISVPYYNPLRRVLAPFRQRDWRVVREAATDEQEFFSGKKFFQYAYRPSEFEKMLDAAGLKVLEKQGYAILWGLYELPFLKRNTQNKTPAPVSALPIRKTVTAVNLDELIKDRPASFAKRLAVNEDDALPVLGWSVKFMRWAAANMMMYVCVSKESKFYG